MQLWHIIQRDTQAVGLVDGSYSPHSWRKTWGRAALDGCIPMPVTMEPFSASDPLELSDIRRQRISNFDVTADGQRFLVTVPAGSGDTGDTAPGARINVVINWFEELKQRVPTGR